VRSVRGRTFWTKPKISEDIRKTVMTDLESKFDDYYTVRMANYPIEERYLTASQAITTNADV